MACTRPNASDRPTAKDLLDFTKRKSTKSQVEVNILKGQLVEKDRVIAEKDKMIEDLRLEVERMRVALLLTNGDPVHPDDQVVVEDAETFEEE
jgi:hypothetical protein